MHGSNHDWDCSHMTHKLSKSCSYKKHNKSHRILKALNHQTVNKKLVSALWEKKKKQKSINLLINIKEPYFIFTIHSFILKSLKKWWQDLPTITFPLKKETSLNLNMIEQKSRQPLSMFTLFHANATLNTNGIYCLLKKEHLHAALSHTKTKRCQ